MRIATVIGPWIRDLLESTGTSSPSNTTEHFAGEAAFTSVRLSSATNAAYGAGVEMDTTADDYRGLNAKVWGASSKTAIGLIAIRKSSYDVGDILPVQVYGFFKDAKATTGLTAGESCGAGAAGALDDYAINEGGTNTVEHRMLAFLLEAEASGVADAFLVAM